MIEEGFKFGLGLAPQDDHVRMTNRKSCRYCGGEAPCYRSSCYLFHACLVAGLMIAGGWLFKSAEVPFLIGALWIIFK
jgi:hypothetical protein